LKKNDDIENERIFSKFEIENSVERTLDKKLSIKSDGILEKQESKQKEQIINSITENFSNVKIGTEREEKSNLNEIDPISKNEIVEQFNKMTDSFIELKPKLMLERTKSEEMIIETKKNEAIENNFLRDEYQNKTSNLIKDKKLNSTGEKESITVDHLIKNEKEEKEKPDFIESFKNFKDTGITTEKSSEQTNESKDIVHKLSNVIDSFINTTEKKCITKLENESKKVSNNFTDDFEQKIISNKEDLDENIEINDEIIKQFTQFTEKFIEDEEIFHNTDNNIIEPYSEKPEEDQSEEIITNTSEDTKYEEMVEKETTAKQYKLIDSFLSTRPLSSVIENEDEELYEQQENEKKKFEK